MNAGIRFIRTPWEVVSDESDRIARLVDAIPGWDGYQHAAETLDELRQAGLLMQQVAWLLDLAATREGERDAAMEDTTMEVQPEPAGGVGGGFL